MTQVKNQLYTISRKEGYLGIKNWSRWGSIVMTDSASSRREYLILKSGHEGLDSLVRQLI